MLDQATLDSFTGTEAYHHWSLLFKDVLTDGAQYLAKEGQCFWLMDIIGSLQHKLRVEEFQVWELTVNGKREGFVKCTDGNENKLYAQKVPCTNFSLPYIKLYRVKPCVIMLPSEY